MADAIQQVKQEADKAYCNKQYAPALAAYSRALELCDQQQKADLLTLLYSNRSAAKLALQDFTGALADAQASVAVDDRWVQQQQWHHRVCCILTQVSCPHLQVVEGLVQECQGPAGVGQAGPGSAGSKQSTGAGAGQQGRECVCAPAPQLHAHMSRAMPDSQHLAAAALMRQWLQCLLCRCVCCCSNSRRSRSKASQHLTSSSRQQPYRGTSSSRQLCRNSTLAS